MGDITRDEVVAVVGQVNAEQAVENKVFLGKSSNTILFLWDLTVKLEDKLAAIQRLVDEQAEDESLWFHPQHITEDILQQALRRLHAVIEGEGQ